MKYIAHIQTDIDGNKRIQYVDEHCKNTADFAGNSLYKVNLNYPAYLAGMLHDMGKCKDEFQKYIVEGIGKRGSVIHTFAGARYLLETYRRKKPVDGDNAEDITAEILAYAVAAHHGLFDIENNEIIENGFQHRVDNNGCYYEESRDAYLSECLNKEKINTLMEMATKQVNSSIDKIFSLRDMNTQEMPDDEVSFYMGLLERLILSAVVDGDRSDTAAFMANEKLKIITPKIDWNKYLSRVEEKICNFPEKKPIDIARRKISDICRICADSSESSGGIFRLNVPTGGGKTLSSLRFALAYATKWDKSRIIFTAPLLTILEQNATVLRDFIQDDNAILEHHSNVINSNIEEYEAYSESWNAPIIITTMVQLLNTMFSSKMSSIRRFHSLADSIIVIDEVQTVPLKLLSLFNMMVNFLASVCGATIVLCSATQPFLEQIEHPIMYIPQEIVPYDPELWDIFKRTKLIDGGNCQLKDVPGFAKKVLEETESLLIVCNKKAEAEEIFNAMHESGNCFHLSASMCTDHRKKVLKSIYTSLRAGNAKTICISTQVIEAGVDISFGAVIRLAAGMDSIIQSAGRCNRNAESKIPSPVYILRIEDENLKALNEINRGKASTIDLLNQYSTNPKQFENELISDAAIKYYYKKLYNELSRKTTEFPVNGDTIYNLLSINTNNCKDNSQYYYQQAFKTAGDNFKVFDDSSIDVVVPYEDGAEVIADLESQRATYDFNFMKECLQKAKNYTVSIYNYQKDVLESANGIVWICNGTIAVLDKDFYDEKTGLSLSKKTMEYMEV